MFIGKFICNRSLASMVNVFNFTTCMSSKKRPCLTRPTLIGLNLDRYNDGLRCYPLTHISLMEVVILLLIHTVKHVFKTKQKI